MSSQIRLTFKSDTSQTWDTTNPVLLEGEPGYETDTKNFKVGDGVTKWNLLPYRVKDTSSVTLDIINKTSGSLVGTYGSDTIQSSADGTKLVACVYQGQIYTSTDSGVTWTPRESNRSWKSVASSADGTKLFACAITNKIYRSTDSGVTWTPIFQDNAWKGIACSSDGTKVVACVLGGKIYTSVDSGVTWDARYIDRYWQSVASSADGTKLVACEDYGSYQIPPVGIIAYFYRIYISNDSGLTWEYRPLFDRCTSVAISKDGSKLVACVFGRQIYVSTDGGLRWLPKESNRYWLSVNISPDASIIAAVAHPNVMSVSTDSGLTWNTILLGTANYPNIVFCVSDGGILYREHQLSPIIKGKLVYK